MSDLVITAIIIAIKNTKDYDSYKKYLEDLGYSDYASKEFYEEGRRKIQFENKG